MKRLSIYLLALTLLLQSVAALWVWVGFYTNRDFIAKNLCENRFISNSSCQGQCVLMKKMKDLEEKEQHLPDTKLKEIHLFAHHYQAATLPKHWVHTWMDNPTPHKQIQYTRLFAISIFHPPTVS